MSLITWSNMFSVGVTQIDDQHKKLVEMANQLNDAMRAGHGKEALGKILGELVNYTVYHFGVEEKLMAQHQYPQSPDHKSQHADLVKEVGAFKTKFDKGDTAMSAEIMNFLRDWLTNHIMKTDKLFGKFLNEHGVK